MHASTLLALALGAASSFATMMPPVQRDLPPWKRVQERPLYVAHEPHAKHSTKNDLVRAAHLPERAVKGIYATEQGSIGYAGKRMHKVTRRRATSREETSETTHTTHKAQRRRSRHERRADSRKQQAQAVLQAVRSFRPGPPSAQVTAAPVTPVDPPAPTTASPTPSAPVQVTLSTSTTTTTIVVPTTSTATPNLQTTVLATESVAVEATETALTTVTSIQLVTALSTATVSSTTTTSTTTTRSVTAAPAATSLGYSKDGYNLDERHTGEGTYFYVGLGACGKWNVDTDYIAAVSDHLYDSFPGATRNPNDNPICGRKVTASWGGKNVTVAIMDRCEGCARWDLDFSPSAFEQLAHKDVGRMKGMTWTWV